MFFAFGSSVKADDVNDKRRG
ncbi:Protein of unknown function [Lactobacillus delbrueckii subsp. lactis]|nr:Protein of unknown function [Lactobacillus delbrueckii subsp. lactis]